VPVQLRTAGEFTELAFRGLKFVDPGLVLVPDWRPDAPIRCPKKSASSAESRRSPDAPLACQIRNAARSS